MKKTTLLIGLACSMAAATSQAAIITLTGANAFGESWLTAADWSNNAVPTAGNDYIADNEAVGGLFRSPSTTGQTFAGDSLTLLGYMHLKSANATVNNLILNNGGVINGGWSGSNGTTLNGGITLADSSDNFFTTGGPDTRTLTINSTIAGTGNLSIDSSDGGFVGTVALTNAANSFTGLLTVTGTGSLDFNYDHDTAAGLSIDSGGLLNLDQTLSFNTLSLLGNSIGAGTYNVADFTALDGSYTGLFTDGGGSITVVVPEPSSALLLGLGGLALVARRRRA